MKSSSMKLYRKKVKIQILLPKRKGEKTNTSLEYLKSATYRV